MRRSLTPAAKKRIAAAGAWRCGLCDATLPAAFQIDHRTPLWDGGSDTPENCWALCASCHADKTQREAIERAERQRAADTSLTCRRCGSRVSPFFTHRC
jgi:hypothetical protein